jgi:hypothetical protein
LAKDRARADVPDDFPDWAVAREVAQSMAPGTRVRVKRTGETGVVLGYCTGHWWAKRAGDLEVRLDGLIPKGVYCFSAVALESEES